MYLEYRVVIILEQEVRQNELRRINERWPVGLYAASKPTHYSYSQTTAIDNM